MRNSYGRFKVAIDNSKLLISAADLRKTTLVNRQVFYHASLAGAVAAWDSFIKLAIREFVSRIGDNTDPDLMVARQLIDTLVGKQLEKFNTPNYENCQALFQNCIAFDITPHWIWNVKSLNSQQVKERLNQILKIRHAFAHGTSLPSFIWLPRRANICYLNKMVVVDVSAFLENLAAVTTTGLERHLSASFVRRIP